MTQVPPTTLSHDSDDHRATPQTGLALAERLRDGEEFAVTFGGQGTDWFATLRELFGEDPRTERLAALVEDSARAVAPVADQLAAALPRPFEPQSWLTEGVVPSAADLVTGSLSLPGRPAHPARHPRPAARRGSRPRPDRPRRRSRPQPGHPRRRRLRRTP